MCNLILLALLYKGNNTINKMNNLQGILIPIIAIVSVFSIPILAIYYSFKQKNREMDERALMIEKGIMPPPLKGAKEYSRNRALQNGLNLLAAGLGLLLGFYIEDAFQLPRVFAIGGSILLFLGIANLILVLLDQKKKDSHEG